MKISTTLTLLIALNISAVYAQQYEVNKNAHSHNDYLQSAPFYNAYSNRFASIEIDVFLVGKELYVAHSKKEIDSTKTIGKLYLEPLVRAIRKNRGEAYKGGGRLQLMIDLKTAGAPALNVLAEKLKPIRNYFDVKNNPNAVRLVFSGLVPSPEQFKDFDEVFYFDGKSGVHYTTEQLSRVAFFSAPLRQFSNWKGKGMMPDSEQQKAVKFVDSVHRIGKPVRFWGNPDTKECWKLFMRIGVDYLNTDSPKEMAAFLRKSGK